MPHVTVESKPVYVHGLGLQDAIYKAVHPEASEREVIAHRWDIKVGPSVADEALVLIHIDGPLDVEMASRLHTAVVGVIRCSAPPGRSQPEVHVRFLTAS